MSQELQRKYLRHILIVIYLTKSCVATAFGIRVIIVQPGYFPTNFFEAAIPPDTNTVYTEPSQGYNVLRVIPKAHLESGQLGDKDKAAMRIFEAVSGTGMMKNLETDWLRLPLGPDCGEIALQKLAVMKKNYEVFEPIWRSTDMDEAQVEAARESSRV